MKIVFASPYCVLDNTSGAALSMQTMLAALHRAGHQTTAFSATIFDTQVAAERAPKPPADHKPQTLFTAEVDGVRHVLLPTPHWRRALMYAADQEIFERQFQSMLDLATPDVIITYGGMLLERSILSLAKEKGVTTVFYLVNPGYHERLTFKDVDLVVTDSQSTADLYKERLALDVGVIGHMIDPSRFIAARRDPKKVIFINPSFEKGVSMAARLALMARDVLPDERFLVVQSRGQWASSLKVLGMSEDDFPNVDVLPMQFDMRVVYEQAKVLIAPSFWHESGGRVALEAMLNGIPVLAPTHGGMGELLDGGGTLLDIPPAIREKPRELVSEAAAQPWFDVLNDLLSNEMSFTLAAARARAAARRFSLEANVTKLLSFIDQKRSTMLNEMEAD